MAHSGSGQLETGLTAGLGKKNWGPLHLPSIDPHIVGFPDNQDPKKVPPISGKHQCVKFGPGHPSFDSQASQELEEQQWRSRRAREAAEASQLEADGFRAF